MTTLVQAANEDDIIEGKGLLRVLDENGDTKIEWNHNTDVEVDHARETFNRFREKGYTAYRMSARGERGEVIREFDPNAEKLIMAPALRGG